MYVLSDLKCINDSISRLHDGQHGEWMKQGLHMNYAMDHKPENIKYSM